MPASNAPSVLPLDREARLRLIRDRLARGDYQTMDAARSVARCLLRDDFRDAHR